MEEEAEEVAEEVEVPVGECQVEVDPVEVEDQVTENPVGIPLVVIGDPLSFDRSESSIDQAKIYRS